MSTHHLQEQQRLSRELRLSQQRFEQLAAYNHTFLWDVDAEGRYTYIGHTVVHLLGYRPEDLMGRFFYEFLHPEDLENVKKNVMAVFDRREPFQHFENRLVTKTGESVWVSTDGLPLHDAEGRFQGYRGMDVEITERKKIEAELREAKKEAEAANQAKSIFLANMSYEIRTPITGLLGFADLLLQTELTEEQQSYARMVYDSTKSLMNVLDDILDFSKIESHNLILEPVEFRLSDLLDSCMASMAQIAWKKGLELICRMDPALNRPLLGDPFRVRQILTHLLINAIKFTEIGEVTVESFLKRDFQDGVEMRFKVTDTGRGIPACEREGLFRKFSQLEDLPARTNGGAGLGLGLGLGLTICRHLVDLMSGEIGMEPNPGGGSIFSFTVCLQKAKLEDDETTGWEIPVHLPNKRVLVVDDNPRSLAHLTEMLTSWGVRTEGAGSAASALRKMERSLQENEPYDCMLIDMVMPEMDGLSLGESIRADHRFVNTRLVLVVPLCEEDIPPPHLKNRFHACTYKPIRQKELLSVLSQSLNTPSLEDTP